MGTTMGIRLDYGTYPLEEEDDDDTGSAISSPAPFTTGHNEHLQYENSQQAPRWRDVPAPAPAPTPPLSDFFSDPLQHINSDDFLNAESDMGSSASTFGRNTVPWPLSHRMEGGNGNGSSSSSQTFAASHTYSPAVIDLTDSPPETLTRQPREFWSSCPRNPTHSQARFTMLPPHNSASRSERLPGQPLSPHQTEAPPRKRRRVQPLEPPVTPQQQQQQQQHHHQQIQQSASNAATSSASFNSQHSPIEAIDLTEVNNEADMGRALAHQQQAAIQAQQIKVCGQYNPDDALTTGRTALSGYKCPICMDTPEDATSTICGHLFCHKCIIDTLRFSEAQRRANDAATASSSASTKQVKGTCPVCRKPLTRKDESGNGRALVPLEIKLVVQRRGFGFGADSLGKKGKEIERNLGGGNRQRLSSVDMWRDLTTLGQAGG